MFTDVAELLIDERDAINLPGHWDMDEIMAGDLELALDIILQYSSKIVSTSPRYEYNSTDAQKRGATELHVEGNPVRRALRPKQASMTLESDPNLNDSTPSMGDLARKLSADLEKLRRTNRLMISTTQELNSMIDQIAWELGTMQRKLSRVKK